MVEHCHLLSWTQELFSDPKQQLCNKNADISEEFYIKGGVQNLARFFSINKS